MGIRPTFPADRRTQPSVREKIFIGCFSSFFFSADLEVRIYREKPPWKIIREFNH